MSYDKTIRSAAFSIRFVTVGIGIGSGWFLGEHFTFWAAVKIFGWPVVVGYRMAEWIMR